MAPFISIEESVSLPAVRFLRPNDWAEISFTPRQGALKITVSAVQVGGTKVTGKVDANPNDDIGDIDISIKQKVKLQVTLDLVGTKKVFEFKDGLSGVGSLDITVPASLSGKKWHAKVKNIGRTDAKVGLTANFVGKWHLTKTTAIPLRVLNNAAQQAIEALGLIIHVGGSNSFVDFSSDIKKLSGGRIKRKSFSVPGIITDFNLRTLRAHALTRDHKAVVRILVDFETAGAEIQLAGIPLADINKAAVEVEFQLQVIGQSGKRRLLPHASVRVDFETSNLPADIPLIALDEEGVKEAIKDVLLDVLTNENMMFTLGEYFTQGMVQLSQRGHAFHNLSVDLRNFLIDHYDPDIILNPEEDLRDPGPPSYPARPSPGPKPVPPELPANLAKIEHIVVLMQENRSFDHMVGYLQLHGNREDVDGLTGEEGNSAPELGVGVPVRVNPLGNTDLPYSPHHEHDQVLLQIANGEMSGFVRSYIDRFPGVDPRFGMGFFGAAQVPTFDFFAREFLLCDRWFCSHPGPTQPNRIATLSGQILQLDNLDVDDPELGFFRLPTIFDHLTAAGISWVYYEQDVAFLRFYDRYRLDDTNVIPFHDSREGFFARARAGRLPRVTFIDPNFVDVPPIRTANDDHPPANIRLGQDMMACIYDTLIESPQWDETLFIITYDEHGGFYDHVPPPGTARSALPDQILFTDAKTATGVSGPHVIGVPPVAKLHPEGPTFLGVRVPTFVISPWVPRTSVDHTVFDHTSITKTILLRFLRDKMPDMGLRVQQASHLGTLLTNEKPRLKVPRLGTRCPPRPYSAPRVPEEFGKLPPHKAEQTDFHEAVRRFGKPKF